MFSRLISIEICWTTRRYEGTLFSFGSTICWEKLFRGERNFPTGDPVSTVDATSYITLPRDVRVITSESMADSRLKSDLSSVVN